MPPATWDVVVNPGTEDQQTVQRGFPTRFQAFMAIQRIRDETGTDAEYAVLESVSR